MNSFGIVMNQKHKDDFKSIQCWVEALNKENVPSIILFKTLGEKNLNLGLTEDDYILP